MNVFVYGSLMHHDEIEKTFGSNVEFHKSILTGHLRDFSKKAHSWGSNNSGRGVLGLTPATPYWCNGLIVEELDNTQIDNYYQRETGYSKEEYNTEKSGYEIKEVDSSQFYFYKGAKEVEGLVLTALINDRLDSAETNEEYRNLCHEAARQHGEQFYNDFVDTTFEFHDEL